MPLNRNRHKRSPYLLTGLLRSKQGNNGMSGYSCSRPGKVFRYYMVAAAKRKPSAEYDFNGTIPAEPLEQQVLQLVRDACTPPDQLHEMVRDYVERRLESLGNERVALAALMTERKAAEDEVIWLASFGGRCADALKPKAEQLEARLRSLDAEIARAKRALENDALDPDAVAKSVCGQITTLIAEDAEHSAVALKRLLNAMVSKLEVDMKTRELEVELRLPKWAVTSKSQLLDHVCVDTSIGTNTSDHTNTCDGLKLANFTCRLEGKARSKARCWECSRSSLSHAYQLPQQNARAQAA